MNEGVKRIYADMKEQNLESPIYTETEQAVTLILKNNIEQRNIKRKEVETTQDATQGTTQATQATQTNQESSVEERILELIKEDPKIFSHPDTSTFIIKLPQPPKTRNETPSLRAFRIFSTLL